MSVSDSGQDMSTQSEQSDDQHEHLNTNDVKKKEEESKAKAEPKAEAKAKADLEAEKKEEEERKKKKEEAEAKAKAEAEAKAETWERNLQDFWAKMRGTGDQAKTKAKEEEERKEKEEEERKKKEEEEKKKKQEEEERKKQEERKEKEQLQKKIQDYIDDHTNDNKKNIFNTLSAPTNAPWWKKKSPILQDGFTQDWDNKDFKDFLNSINGTNNENVDTKNIDIYVQYMNKLLQACKQKFPEMAQATIVPYLGHKDREKIDFEITNEFFEGKNIETLSGLSINLNIRKKLYKTSCAWRNLTLSLILLKLFLKRCNKIKVLSATYQNSKMLKIF
jgi:hypothetical protein